MAADNRFYYLCVNNNRLEIISGVELAKPLYDKKEYFVLASADTRAQAFELVRFAVEEFIRSGRDIDKLSEHLKELNANPQ